MEHENAHKILVGIPEGKKPRGIPMRSWEVYLPQKNSQCLSPLTTSAPFGDAEKWNLSPDGGDSGSKKYKRDYGDVYGGV
jgi:hypothetical protein